ncbi:hypothetical protein IKL64_05050 [bacterium]|nr:hypothetical protein [bacterium]
MNYFDENKNFFGVKGVLGRRDFIVNCLIVELIEALVFMTPLLFAVMFNSDVRTAIVDGAKPLWLLIMQCVVGLTSSALYFPSIVRRVRDIIGEEDDNRIFLVASVIVVIIFMGYTPVASSFFGGWLLLFTLFSLFFMRGRITGQNPKSEIIKFNWGAFWGTWIWGLCNKIPRTLIVLPLFLTCAWFPFVLICGMKGNEWLYNKNQDKINDINLFHNKQQNQAILFGILAPVIVVIISFMLTVVAIFSFRLYSKSNPEFVDNLQASIQQMQLDSVESGFERVELKDGVYRFYMDPEDWALSASKPIFKQSIISAAINYVLLKDGKNSIYLKDRLESVNKLNTIKVYSTFNEEVLGEFYMDPNQAKEYLKDIEDPEKIPEIRKAIIDSYKYNNNPAIP